MNAVDTELDLLVTNLTAINIGLEGGRKISLNAKRLQNFIDMLWETKSNDPPKNEDGSIKKDEHGDDMPKSLPYAVIQTELAAFIKKESLVDLDDWETLAIWGYVTARKYDSGQRDEHGNPIMQTIIEKKREGLLNQEAVALASPTSPQSSDPRFSE